MCRSIEFLLCALICVTACSPALSRPASGAEDEKIPVYRLDPIVVTANRAPTTFSHLLRSLSIIDSTAVEASLASSIQELLEESGDIDVRQRGPMGVQGDISIRGGTFGETLLLVDGAKVSDPQTSHHNTNLPLTPYDIERIEILKGPGSRLYGPNAFGGVVNIITKNAMRRRLRVKSAGGDFRFYEGIISVDQPFLRGSQHFSISRKKSDGYRPNTDFDIWSLFYHSSFPVPDGRVTVSAGYIDNEFGANSFYVDPSKSTSEWERVRTALITAASEIHSGPATASPQLTIRRNEDHYLFDRYHPSLYENRHTTWSITGENTFVLRSPVGITAVGMELGREEIISTRLDTLSRWKGGVSLEQHFSPGTGWLVVLGGFAYRYSRWDWQVWPGIDVGYAPSSAVRMYGSINRSFRIPTYTELYYISPSNVGDPELGPEEGWMYEIGSACTLRSIRASLALFYRDGEHIIDWIRTAGSTDLWRAAMIGDVAVWGFETDLGIGIDRFSLMRLHAGYTFLDSERSLGDLESAYALAYLTHQAHLSLSQRLSPSIRADWRCRYERRREAGDQLLVDVDAGWDTGPVRIFMEISNLLNTSYEDIRSLPLPGRWLRAGVELSLAPTATSHDANTGN